MITLLSLRGVLVMLKKIKQYAQQAQQDVPALFIALKRQDTPKFAKFFALFTIGYALSPIDFIPDFIPIIGYFDDFIFLPILTMLTIHLIPAGIFLQCREEAKDLWLNGKPQKWYYALPVIFLWILVISFIGYIFFPSNLQFIDFIIFVS